MSSNIQITGFKDLLVALLSIFSIYWGFKYANYKFKTLSSCYDNISFVDYVAAGDKLRITPEMCKKEQ